MAIHSSVLDLIGHTPIVKAQRLDTGVCELFLKLESANPGGSIKDRIGLSMIEAAVELAGDQLSTAMIQDILAAGRVLLAHPVELFDGVEETLERLANIGPLVLVTKGDLLHQESKLAASGLGDLFSGIEIVSDKKVDTFRTLFARHGIAPEQAVMAGDSMRSDILPALEAGAWAAFIPQEGAWSHERAQPPIGAARYTQLERLGELPDWIAGIN